jgi:glycosyltransferase involved in cell wall biosynthesis
LTANQEKNPIVSVITPTYNQARFIKATIESVLSQNYSPLEYIIVDDGSTDTTRDILESYGTRLRWITKHNAGQSSAVNDGWRMASGDILGWLNSDDMYLPNAVSTAVSFLQNHPDVDAVYGGAYDSDEEGHLLRRSPTEPFNLARLAERDIICQPSVFLRRSLVERIGGLDASLYYCMDYEYWIRIGQSGSRFGFVPEYLAVHRVHHGTKTASGGATNFVEIMEMLRRRYGYVPISWICAYAKERAFSDRDRTRVRLPRYALRIAAHSNSAFWRFNSLSSLPRALRWRGIIRDVRALFQRTRSGHPVANLGRDASDAQPADMPLPSRETA